MTIFSHGEIFHFPNQYKSPNNKIHLGAINYKSHRFIYPTIHKYFMIKLNTLTRNLLIHFLSIKQSFIKQFDLWYSFTCKLNYLMKWFTQYRANNRKLESSVLTITLRFIFLCFLLAHLKLKQEDQHDV